MADDVGLIAKLKTQVEEGSADDARQDVEDTVTSEPLELGVEIDKNKLKEAQEQALKEAQAAQGGLFDNISTPSAGEVMGGAKKTVGAAETITNDRKLPGKAAGVGASLAMKGGKKILQRRGHIDGSDGDEDDGEQNRGDETEETGVSDGDVPEAAGQNEAIPILQDQLEVQKEILEILRTWDQDGGDGGGGRGLRGRLGQIGMMGGGAALLGMAGMTAIAADKLIEGTINIGEYIDGAIDATIGEIPIPEVDINPSDIIQSAAAVGPGAVIASKATIAAADVIGEKTGINPGDVISSLASVSVADVIDSAAEVEPADVIGTAAKVTAGALVGTMATVTVAKLIEDKVDINPGDIVAGTLTAGAVIDKMIEKPSEGSEGGTSTREKAGLYGASGTAGYAAYRTWKNTQGGGGGGGSKGGSFRKWMKGRGSGLSGSVISPQQTAMMQLIEQSESANQQDGEDRNFLEERIASLTDNNVFGNGDTQHQRAMGVEELDSVEGVEEPDPVDADFGNESSGGGNASGTAEVNPQVEIQIDPSNMDELTRLVDQRIEEMFRDLERRLTR